MSVKKQIPSLCQFYSFYEKIIEEFLNETDVDSYSSNEIILFYLGKRLYINNFLVEGLDCLSVKTFHVEQVPLKR